MIKLSGMRHLLSLFLVIAASSMYAQIDLNNYTTLLSSGPIPEDFTLPTYEKLEEDIANSTVDMNRSDKQEFYTGVNYTVDALLHSGSIIYGDPITEYVEDVAKKLLIKDKKLFNELRFYTIKSNSTNAFATDQGIVFVTTGLLSQITSEAQLAFVLAHEISHYKQEHVLDSYNYNRDNRSASIEQMSVYSQDKELEADRLGLEMYARAGYSKDEIFPTFDVLLYSYLPFDEIPVPDSYLTDFDSLFVPDYLFPDKPYEIEAVDDEDDSQSSHPNIKTRKDAIKPELESIRNWKNDVFKLGEDRFYEVQNIARFEVVRLDIHNAEYANALYSIFLLERKFPESVFLQRMKAHAWLGILQYRLDNSLFSVVDRKSELEGSSAKVHHFIKEMSKDQLITMCIRQIASVREVNPEDDEIAAAYDRMVFGLANNDKFDLDDYHKVSFQTTYDRIAGHDTLTLSDTTSTEKKENRELNKLDRINNRASGDGLSDHGVVNLDTSDFHLYLIPDVIKDKQFIDSYDYYHAEFKKQEDEEKKLRGMTPKERYYYEKEKKQKKGFKKGISVNHLISMEPMVVKYGLRGIKNVKSEVTREKTRECIDIAAWNADIQISHLDRKTLEQEGTQSYNDFCILKNYLEQAANNTDINSMPVDYALVNNVREKFGTPYVMYSLASHGYVPDFATSGTLYSILIFPSIPFYFPIKLFTGHRSEISMLVVDIGSGEVIGAVNHDFKSTLRKHVLGSHIYSLFNTLNNLK